MKRGFVVSAVLYPLLILGLSLMMIVLSMSDNRRKVLDNLKLEVSEESDTDPEMSNSALYYKMQALEEAYAEISSRLSEERIEEIQAETKEETKRETLLTGFPVGSIFTSTTDTNPANYIGGTWETYGKGRTLVGVDEEQTEFNVTEKEGGSLSFSNIHTHTIAGHTHTTKDHTLTLAQIPSHSHDVIDTSGRRVGLWNTNAGSGTIWPLYSYNVSGSNPFAHTRAVGGSGAHNHGETDNSGTQITNASGNETQSLLQPYITVYFWKRTA